MPSLSPTMSAGTIVKWHKKEGDKISPGDVLCEVQTDKAVMAYEFDDEGVLAKILIDESSSEIPVGQLIAIVCGEDDDWKAVKVPSGAAESSQTSVPKGSGQVPAATSSTTTASSSSDSPTLGLGAFKMGPSARNLLHKYGIDSTQTKATGNRGTLLKEDVLRFITEKKLSPKPFSDQSSSGKATTGSKAPKSFYVDIELTNMRRTIAKRLTESKSGTPHAYMSIKCFMDDVLQLRSKLKNEAISVSVNDLIVKASALALKQVPEMNCLWDAASNSAKLQPDVDISIAVATPTGLITPIIRNANRLTLAEINMASRELINKAKDGKLQPNDFIGGTFSISNLGMYDIDYFTGVINPPQAAILAVGSTKKMFTGEPDNFKLRSRMTVSLSYDARAIDEETVAQFLEKLQGNLEQPNLLLNSDGTSRRRLSALL